MDWLRSEDLKEEKVTTTSNPTIAPCERISLFQLQGQLTSFRLRHPEARAFTSGARDLA